MNLLGRFQTYMKKLRPGFIFMIPVFLGCETSDDLGVEYDLGSQANVEFVEFVLPSTNIVVDSLRTDSENKLLVGNYSDDLVGSISAQSYFSIGVRSSNIPSRTRPTSNPADQISSEFKFDSIRLFLESESVLPKFFTGSRTQAFDIHVLEDTLSSLVYLSSKREVLGEKIGSFEFSFDSIGTFKENILLSNSFGNGLFEILNQDIPIIGIAGWPTLAIVSSQNSEIINEISLLNDTTTGLFLYVTDTLGIEEINLQTNDTTYRDTTYTVEFGLFSNTILPGYISLERDKANSPFSNLTDNDTLNLNGGNTIVDPLAGVTTKFSIHPFANFIKQLEREERTIIINNATLSFSLNREPSRNTLENLYSFFYINNDFNGSGRVSNPFNSVIMSNDGFLDRQNIPAVTSFSDDELNVNVTLFLQQIYNEFINGEEPLDERTLSVEEFVSLSQINTTLQRSIISSDGIKLNIFYTDIN